MCDIEKKILEIIKVLSENNCTELGILTGNCGIALFFGYINKLYNNSDLDMAMEASLNKCFSKLEKEGAKHTFSEGLAGLCWGINHLVIQNKIEADIDSLFEELEPSLFSMTDSNLHYAFFDFMHGGLGAGIYCLDRTSDTESMNCILKTIEALHKHAKINKGEVTWRTIVGVENGVEIFEYNLGLSHGIPSIIWFLCKCHELKIEQEKCSELIEGALKWLLNQKLAHPTISVFPSVIEGLNTKKYSRLGWCYGDLGVASAIWQAGKALNNDQWKEEAIEVMKSASQRKNYKPNGIYDASLCHGTAGIAHIFNRFYLETGISIFKEAAHHWVGETLKMASHKDGVAGFKMMRDDFSFENESGILEGAAGIGLALSGFLTTDIKDLSWDRCLLLS